MVLRPGSAVTDSAALSLQGHYLGVGGQGAVMLAKFQGGCVAFKCIPQPKPGPGLHGRTELSDLHNRRVLSEAVPLLRLRHTRIVQLVGVVLQGNTRGIVMEYIPSTLEDWLEEQRYEVSCGYAEMTTTTGYSTTQLTTTGDLCVCSACL